MTASRHSSVAAHSNVRHRLAARLLIVLWLPFCCCQLQGAAAFATGSDDVEASIGCGGGCCSTMVGRPGVLEPTTGNDLDDDVPNDVPNDGPKDSSPGEPCSASCCVRGESSPPKWELPAGRLVTIVGFEARGVATPPSVADSRPDDVAPDPPWILPLQARVRLQV